MTVVVIAGKPYAQWSSNFSLIKILDGIVLMKETHMRSFGCARNPWIWGDFHLYYAAYNLCIGIVYNEQHKKAKEQMKKWNWLIFYIGRTGAVFIMKYHFPLLVSIFSAALPVVTRAILASSENTRGVQHVTFMVQSNTLG